MKKNNNNHNNIIGRLKKGLNDQFQSAVTIIKKVLKVHGLIRKLWNILILKIVF